MLAARKLYPDKKIIPHYLQPYYPFLESDLQTDGTPRYSKTHTSIWHLAERGKVSRSEVWNPCKHNLEILQENLEKLSGLEGRTLVTSDHGNQVGKNDLYGHTRNIVLKPLRKVLVEYEI